MIRLKHILDPELREKIRELLAERRGLLPSAVPDWYELDDADYVDLLNELQASKDDPAPRDPRE